MAGAPSPRRRGGGERLLASLDLLFDRTRHGLRWMLRRRPPLAIETYLGFGDARCLRFAGRVRRCRRFLPPDPAHRARRNMLELAKRMASGKQPHARLRARYAGIELELVADSEGYFDCALEPPQPLAPDAWPVLELELLRPPPRSGPVRAEARALVPGSRAQRLVISDLDDTVLRSHVTSKLRMLWLLLRSNAHTRKPFGGVAALYRALVRGPDGAEANPVFYVSSSPWNLHEPLLAFLEHQFIPVGPLLLRDFGEHTLFSMHAHGSHKLEAIGRILQAYPRMPVVLIGDSGEQDPEIYAAIARSHPGRVRAAYIRDVSADAARSEAIRALAADFTAAGAELVLVDDSIMAAEHAVMAGFIAAHEVDAVRGDCAEDARAPPF